MHENFRRNRTDLLGGIVRRGSTDKKETKRLLPIRKTEEDVVNSPRDLDQNKIIKQLQFENKKLLEHNRMLIEENKKLTSTWNYMKDGFVMHPSASALPFITAQPFPDHSQHHQPHMQQTAHNIPHATTHHLHHRGMITAATSQHNPHSLRLLQQPTAYGLPYSLEFLDQNTGSGGGNFTSFEEDPNVNDQNGKLSH